jgi:hypothetical protein
MTGRNLERYKSVVAQRALVLAADLLAEIVAEGNRDKIIARAYGSFPKAIEQALHSLIGDVEAEFGIRDEDWIEKASG